MVTPPNKQPYDTRFIESFLLCSFMPCRLKKIEFIMASGTALRKAADVRLYNGRIKILIRSIGNFLKIKILYEKHLDMDGALRLFLCQTKANQLLKKLQNATINILNGL